jgi:hypothetical protein
MAMPAKSAIDNFRLIETQDAARREWLAEDPAHQHAAIAMFIVSTMQAALSLKHCIEVGDATGWPRPATDSVEAISSVIRREFRKQFGRELFDEDSSAGG